MGKGRNEAGEPDNMQVQLPKGSGEAVTRHLKVGLGIQTPLTQSQSAALRYLGFHLAQPFVSGLPIKTAQARGGSLLWASGEPLKVTQRQLGET